jgi:hypothetical protein
MVRFPEFKHVEQFWKALTDKVKGPDWPVLPLIWIKYVWPAISPEATLRVAVPPEPTVHATPAKLPQLDPSHKAILGFGKPALLITIFTPNPFVGATKEYQTSLAGTAIPQPAKKIYGFSGVAPTFVVVSVVTVPFCIPEPHAPGAANVPKLAAPPQLSLAGCAKETSAIKNKKIKYVITFFIFLYSYIRTAVIRIRSYFVISTQLFMGFFPAISIT